LEPCQVECAMIDNIQSKGWSLSAFAVHRPPG
jgi:hypothetical protein